MAILTAPPKESIGNNKPHHTLGHVNALETYKYALDLQEFRDSSEWVNTPLDEQDDIEKELILLERLNEIQVRKVERY